MAGSVNKVILIGNLGKDPEIRRTQDGRPIANLSVATAESWRDKATGERRERTEWHRVVIFNEGLCRMAEQYLKKGSKVYLEGQLQTRKWQDQSGQDKYTTEVVLQGFNSQLTMLDRACDRGDLGADERRIRFLRAFDAREKAGAGRCRLARGHGRRNPVLIDAARLRRAAGGSIQASPQARREVKAGISDTSRGVSVQITGSKRLLTGSQRIGGRLCFSRRGAR